MTVPRKAVQPGKAVTSTAKASRRTQQRAMIVAALHDHGGTVSAQELHQRLEDVGLATVYRNLSRLAESGEIDVIRRPTGELAYRTCGAGHHHHLVCRECGAVVEIHDCEIGDWAAKLARSHGYAQIEHHAELVGTCADCR
jgi:Fur family ferric uptake transcriptional regulator